MTISHGAVTAIFTPPSSLKITGQLSEVVLRNLIMQLEEKYKNAKSALERFDITKFVEELHVYSSRSPHNINSSVARLKHLRYSP